MIGIFKEARPNIIDNTPGRRRFGSDTTRKLDRIPVADQTAQIDRMVGCGDNLDRSSARIDPRQGKSPRGILLYHLIGGRPRLFRCADVRHG